MAKRIQWADMEDTPVAAAGSPHRRVADLSFLEPGGSPTATDVPRDSAVHRRGEPERASCGAAESDTEPSTAAPSECGEPEEERVGSGDEGQGGQEAQAQLAPRWADIASDEEEEQVEAEEAAVDAASGADEWQVAGSRARRQRQQPSSQQRTPPPTAQQKAAATQKKPQQQPRQSPPRQQQHPPQQRQQAQQPQQPQPQRPSRRAAAEPGPPAKPWGPATAGGSSSSSSTARNEAAASRGANAASASSSSSKSGWSHGDNRPGGKATTTGGRAAGSAAAFGKPQCQFIIGIEEDREFRVTRRLLGPRGENMKHINEETGVKLRLRGRGSGFKEGPEMKESSDPLMLCLSAPDSRSYEKAKAQVSKLLEDIYGQYCGSRAGGGRRPQLNIHEGPRLGSH